MEDLMPAPAGYIDVASRIGEFRDKHPEGSLQPANLAAPFDIIQLGDQQFIVVVAAAYRSPEDPRPGIGMAYEEWPGRTNFTRGSELQNAETSAWGRAIVAALAADTRQGVASADEVRNRREEQTPEAQRARATNSAAPMDPEERERAALLHLLPKFKLTPADAVGLFSDQNKGKDLRTADAETIAKFRQRLVNERAADATQ
jgi:hypothetical protein